MGFPMFSHVPIGFPMDISMNFHPIMSYPISLPLCSKKLLMGPENRRDSHKKKAILSRKMIIIHIYIYTYPLVMTNIAMV